MTEIHLSSDDEDMDSAAMMQAMGFSGFGTQRPAKKRRVDAGTADDAPSGTGANTAPLGERRPLTLPPPSASLPARPVSGAAPASGNADEIDLEDDEDAGGVGVSDDVSQAETASTAFSRRGENHPRGQRGGRAGHALRRGGAAGEKEWWVGYYDAKTNENPWAKLERERGLEPRGVWLERGGNAFRRGTGAEKAQPVTAAVADRGQGGHGVALVEDEQTSTPDAGASAQS